MLIPLCHLCKKYSLHPPGCLHLGANEGQEALAYLAQGIGQVVWVEADPVVFERLKMKIAPIPGSVALLACVGDVDGQQVLFNVANNQGQSSSFLELGTHAQEHPTVKYTRQIPMATIRVDTLLEREEIKVGNGWFLNIDLQGAELMALRGMGDLLIHFDSAFIEVNEKELYIGCPFIREIDSWLSAKGFERKEIKMTGAGWGDAFYLRV